MQAIHPPLESRGFLALFCKDPQRSEGPVATSREHPPLVGIRTCSFWRVVCSHFLARRPADLAVAKEAAHA